MIQYNREPQEIKTAVPNGNYEVTLGITAHADAIYTVYCQNRRFVAVDRKISAGETQKFTFVVNVCDYIRRDAAYTVDSIQIYIVCDSDLSVVSEYVPVQVPTLYIIGDSTVTDQPAEYPYAPEKTYCGWGQVLPMFLDNHIAVSNHAESGATSKEVFRLHFETLRRKLRPGDFLMIEFGHNDQKEAELDAFGGYARYLRYYVDFAKVRAVKPILNAPINRIIFDDNGKILNLLGDYRDAVQSVSEWGHVPFIDLWTATTDFFEPLGLYTAKKFFRHDEESQDYTHTNDPGGVIIAKLWAAMAAEAGIKGLSEHILTDRIGIEAIQADPNAPRESNAQEFARLKSIGLGTVPADLDADISHL
ncbi:MAG: rhamnogalacturonan acetylesterase [Lachnospiraceae bacterium]|nr:rhamnogalacturonan acetylesterase [Lachnospiraceae bacterium]